MYLYYGVIHVIIMNFGYESYMGGFLTALVVV